MKRWLIGVGLVLIGLVLIVGGVVWYARRPSKGHPSAVVPADTAVRHPWIYFYPTHRPGPAVGIAVLFGNDVSFWEPHQDLAWRIADDGWSVIGIDLRTFLNTLPSEEPQRDSAVAVALPRLIAGARHALSGDDLPLIVGGHSFGAELAIWLAAKRPPPHLVGVMPINTRGSGHLFITARDWLNEEASGAWSFSTVDLVRAIDPHVRIALVRSEHDRFAVHDSAFQVAGGARLRRFVIPLASHSLRSVLVAKPIIARAVRFLADSTAP